MKNKVLMITQNIVIFVKKSSVLKRIMKKYVIKITTQMNIEEPQISLVNEYQLDPAYFVSTPSLAFEAMLKILNAKIELFTDINMLLVTENGIRGGLRK